MDVLGVSLGVSSRVRLSLLILSGESSSSFLELTLEFFLFTKFFMASIFKGLSKFRNRLVEEVEYASLFLLTSFTGVSMFWSRLVVELEIDLEFMLLFFGFVFEF